uniref:phosphatase PAP2 family protein n=1 Tax=Acetatifactor sp. TaxID=1872090 RepID=UPI0040560E24
MEKAKQLYFKYKHAIPLIIYGIIYLSWFGWLEQKVTKRYHVIHMEIDDYIPFCEVFIVPYFLWFLYVAAVVIYFLFKNKTDYYKTGIFLATGMTIFLAISTLWPNGHHLRPAIMPRDNIFTQLVEMLYNVDTATNLWPSIHVYNSIGAHLAIVHSKEFENRKFIRLASLLLSGSIILSTMFLKQHSFFDVLTAFVLATIMYLLVYRYDILVALRNNRHRNANPQIS